jgi:hypothetical protein
VAAAGWLESHRFKANAVTLPGKVVGPSAPASSPRETNVPIVRFTTPAGEEREVGYSAPLAGDAHAIGEDLSVLYDAATREARLDDWSELYLWPSLLAFVAFIILLPLIAVGILRLAAGRTRPPARDAGQHGR